MMLSSTGPEESGWERKPRDEAGFTLIELLITLVVLSFGLLGLAGLQVQVVRGSAFNQDMTIATSIGTEILESSRAQLMTDFTSLKGKDAPVCRKMDLDGDGKPEDPYRGRYGIVRTVTTVNTTFKKIKVTVSWKDVTGAMHALTFTGGVARR